MQRLIGLEAMKKKFQHKNQSKKSQPFIRLKRHSKENTLLFTTKRQSNTQLNILRKSIILADPISTKKSQRKRKLMSKAKSLGCLVLAMLIKISQLANDSK